MATTYTNFVTNLGNLTVTSVKTLKDEPPLALNTADLPAQWVEVPVGDPLGEENPWTLASHGGYPTHRASLVIAYKPTGQDRQPDNWSGCLTLIDNLATALRAAVKTIVSGQLTWTISVSNSIVVGEHTYWGVVAVVEGTG